jgi:hypothetical protein
MRSRIVVVCFVVILIPILIPAALLGLGGKFITFPDAANELPSPHGQFVVRSVSYGAAPGAFSGKFHALVLEERRTRSSRKLYDYLGKIAVSWVTDSAIIVNEYYTSRGARALMFTTDEAASPIVIDRSWMVKLLDPILSTHLIRNDHVYVEAFKLEGDTLGLRVWGYGAQDTKGFSFSCDYNLDRNTISCRQSSGQPKSVF